MVPARRPPVLSHHCLLFLIRVRGEPGSVIRWMRVSCSTPQHETQNSCWRPILALNRIERISHVSRCLSLSQTSLSQTSFPRFSRERETSKNTLTHLRSRVAPRSHRIRRDRQLEPVPLLICVMRQPVDLI